MFILPNAGLAFALFVRVSVWRGSAWRNRCPSATHGIFRSSVRRLLLVLQQDEPTRPEIAVLPKIVSLGL